MTFTAPEIVLGAGTAPDGIKRSSLFALDPTTGALVVRPEYRAKVEKALMREVRNIKFRLYRHFALLYAKKFLLQCRGAVGKLFRNLTGYFGKPRLNRHI